MTGSPDEDKLYTTNLRVMQILILAMIAGVGAFLTIALTLVLTGKGFAAQPWRLTMPLGAVALVFAVMAIVLSLVVPKVTANASVQKLAGNPPPDETAALLGIVQAAMITGVAFLEGAAFFNLIAFLLERGAIPLVTALILLFLIALRFPTRIGLENQVEDCRRMLR